MAREISPATFHGRLSAFGDRSITASSSVAASTGAGFTIERHSGSGVNHRSCQGGKARLLHHSKLAQTGIGIAARPGALAPPVRTKQDFVDFLNDAGAVG